MGWSGAGANATSEIVHRKISMFRRNMRRRNRASEVTADNIEEGSDLEQQSATSRSQVAGGRRLCDVCPHEGSFVKHLLSEETCLTAHLRQNLSHRVLKYKGRPKLAVFDLGIIGRFCPNPDCEGDLAKHSS